MIRLSRPLSIICVFVCATCVVIPGVFAPSVFGDAPDFRIDVMSVLSKAGCNAGTCHGNLNGKGGFKLSLRGQDPTFDFQSLVLASRGRRVNPSAPGQSLLLRKAIGDVPHQGGVRFESTSSEYQVLLDWIRRGSPGPSGAPSGSPSNELSPRRIKLVRLEVHPPQAVIAAPDSDVQMSVKAWFSDGTSRDVTGRACYELSNLNAEVSYQGRVSRSKYGETTLIVRYLDQQVPVPLAFTQPIPDFRWSDPAPLNEVDTHVFEKLQRLRINPSSLCDDTTFVRRVYLDAVGRAPTATEARAFIGDDHPEKRSRLIDHVLHLDEFADFWALKWADVLRTEEKVLDTRGVQVFHAWIRDNIADGVPLDQFVRSLVTGSGSTFENPAANYYRANRDPATRGETTARLFLGTRLQCAKCHNHPFDRWTQQDYYRWSTLFSQIEYEVGENKRSDKLDKNEFAGDQVVLFAEKEEVRHPGTGESVTPKFLGGAEPALDQPGDRFQALADWLTSPENELFAKSQTNFIWYHVMGRGLVDPIDDFRLTNPPSNPPLLDALADHFVSSGFDVRELIRQIMNSRTYQLSSEPNSSNLHDETSFSRAYVRRLPAEVILDMQSDLLGVPATFAGYDEGIRAVQIPGVKTKGSRGKVVPPGDRFLKTFGKPERILACECERSNDTTLKQAFALIGDGLSERLANPENRIHRWAKSGKTTSEIVDELYWMALSRPPSQVEELAAIEMIHGADGGRAAGLEDLVWALLNAKEFLFRR